MDNQHWLQHFNVNSIFITLWDINIATSKSHTRTTSDNLVN